MLWFWILLRIVLTPIMYAGWWPRNRGMRNVPKRGPALLVSNHLSFADHFFGPLPLLRPIFFIGKGEYFTGRGIKGLVSRAFFTGVGVVPVDRTGGSSAEAALRTGLRILSEGKLLGIYPEGTRAPDNRLYRGKTGVARLALKSRAPVVPMAMINTFELMPPGRRFPRFGIRPGVRFGAPLDFSRHYGREDDHDVLREITDEIMQAIRDLSGQEYVDRYAADVKAELAGGPARDAEDDGGFGGG
ncbi:MULTISPECIES: 1-acyl-sn-glycerol-3-phosphate acyltransferase [Actinomadura]|uniref:1-acyl-sn-glycerol-3-phosphate acyltransferase n=1 Tax=Actinomadura litoris TaxID=2678616 RepID=A0A7K1LC71_9ACTN|nr:MULTISPECIES: lysophospholipid acyltransferase family protein [Actinomadura]MBT2209685.1 1-acyl-sn-glycerol-3-phosphate acyltransferase [Actinomadura sp. NEAU-AAG7]MUN41856.1 1-acyl-sn-glycerol-3-phosphate acyltransferase [Actinomadura litoris]